MSKETSKALEEAIMEQIQESFSSTRYPYTYANDFIRTHQEVLPLNLQTQGVMISRHEASKVIGWWAAEMHMEETELVYILAKCFMKEHNISLK